MSTGALCPFCNTYVPYGDTAHVCPLDLSDGQAKVQRLLAIIEADAAQRAAEQAELARLRAENKRLQGMCERLADAVGRYHQRTIRLCNALEAVEWAYNDSSESICPWCDNYHPDGHREDCQRQAALDAAGDTP